MGYRQTIYGFGQGGDLTRVAAKPRAWLRVAIAALAAVSACACAPDSAHTVATPTPTPTAGERVDPSRYQTYSNYSGYRRDYVTEAQFTTSTGIRCRIGPNTGDYNAGIRCWGVLPGADPTINHAAVKAFPYDRDTHTMITTSPVPVENIVHSFLGHGDPDAQETYLDSGLHRHTVDPSAYTLLEADQMISVQETVGTHHMVSVCAVGVDNTLTCEIQPTSDGTAHGFEISSRGSRTY